MRRSALVRKCQAHEGRYKVIELFDDQQLAVIETRRALIDKRHACLVLPTGAGKTVIAAHIAAKASAAGLVWFLVHRKELVTQATETLRGAGLKVARCIAGEHSWIPPNTNVVVVMATTLIRRGATALPKPHLIIIDEAHHARAKTWETILGWHKDVYRLGLTATPERLDGKGLGDIFRKLVIGATTKELIKAKRLCPYRLRVPEKLYQRDFLKVTAGDFNAGDLDKQTTEKVIGKVCANILQSLVNKRVLVFSASVRASKELVFKLNHEGVKSAHLDGTSPADLRHRTLQDWKSAGGIKIISNVGLFSEGMDAPVCNAIVLARPTTSLTMHLQQIGRGMRYAEGKVCEILDLAGNTLAGLGLPDDDRVWTLRDKDKGQSKREQLQVQLKMCQSCHGAYRVGRECCPYCGEVNVSQQKELDEIDSALIELTPEGMAKKAKEAQDNKLQSKQWRMDIWQAARRGASVKELGDLSVRYGFKRGYGFVVKRQISGRRQRR